MFNSSAKGCSTRDRLNLHVKHSAQVVTQQPERAARVADKREQDEAQKAQEDLGNRWARRPGVMKLHPDQAQPKLSLGTFRSSSSSIISR